jgi:aminopeptidase
MRDARYDLLGRQLVGFSARVRRGDHVLIEAFDIPAPMTVALVRAVRGKGGVPFVNLHDAVIGRELAMGVTEPQCEVLAGIALEQMRHMDVYIALRGSHNITELSDVPPRRMNLLTAHMRPVLDWRIKETRWVVLRWPTAAMAQQAGMSTEAFEDFYFRVCLQDYRRFATPMRALKRLMDRTDEVRIIGEGTDLRFSLKGMGSVACGGQHNIPDGEVFSAPVRNSVEGQITYNTPSIYQGIAFDRVYLRFEKGRIVEAKCNDTKAINRILDQDDGARYIGEFALGFNPEIREPMRDILFDEKIAGSFHFTPGQAYDGVSDNGNRSQVHWDLVQIQRPEYGGGEIWFDGKLIRRDGKFLLKSLSGLNG